MYYRCVILSQQYESFIMNDNEDNNNDNDNNKILMIIIRY